MANATTNRTITASREALLDDNIFIVAPGVWRMKDIFVNVFIIQNLESTNWLLVDTGLKTSAPKIKNMVCAVFAVRTHGPLPLF